jgi:hypothetical protein
MYAHDSASSRNPAPRRCEGAIHRPFCSAPTISRHRARGQTDVCSRSLHKVASAMRQFAYKPTNSTLFALQDRRFCRSAVQWRLACAKIRSALKNALIDLDSHYQRFERNNAPYTPKPSMPRRGRSSALPTSTTHHCWTTIEEESEHG